MKINACYLTPTRYMGVVAGYIDYHVETTRYVEFYHIEYETYGLDRYEQLVDPKEYQLKSTLQEFCGGLGAKPIALKSSEFAHVIQAAKQIAPLSRPLHRAMASSRWLCSPFEWHRTASEDARLAISERIKSRAHLINLFLMRYLGGDAIYQHLATQTVAPYHKQYTVVRNQVERVKARHYRFTSLVLADQYEILAGEIEVDKRLVSAFKVSEQMLISDIEAAMMLRRDEYIYVYDIDELSDVEGHLLAENKYLSPMLYQNGRLYTCYYPHNRHTMQHTYYLNGDVEAYLYFTDSAQLVLCSYSKRALQKWDERLSKRFQSSIDKYEEWDFEDPILYDFITSEFVDFDDYIDQYGV